MVARVTSSKVIYVRHPKKYQKLSEYIRRNTYDWIIKYQYITPSPNINNTLIIHDQDNLSEIIHIPKLLLGCSICELYNNPLSKSLLGFLETYDNNKKPIISDTTLKILLPQKVKKYQ